MYRLLLLGFLSLISFCKSSLATHIAGLEMSYSLVPGTTNSYIFLVRYYQDCGYTGQTNPGAPPLSLSLCYKSSCATLIQSANLSKVIGIVPTNPPSPNGSVLYNACNTGTTCTNINAINQGYRQWWYQDTVVLNDTCNSWHFWVSLCCRNDLSMNIGPQLPGSYDLYVDAYFDNTVSTINSSPFFMYADSIHKLPIPQACINFPFLHTGGVYDADGDSIFVETIMPRSGQSCTAGPSYNILSTSGVPPYNVNSVNGNPIACNNTYNLDPATGIYGFIPAQIGHFVLAHRANEYRNGQWIGSTTRDVQLVIKNCGGYASSDTIHVCAGDNVMFPDSTWFMNAQYDTAQVSVLNGVSNNCDSLIMTIVYLDSVNATITQIGATLQADTTNASLYQWFTCNPLTAIGGATSSTYTPTTNGDYALVVTVGNCSDTSSCFSYFATTNSSIASEQSLQIFPNPATNEVQLLNFSHEQLQQLRITNSQAQPMKVIRNGNRLQVNHWKAGVYFLHVNSTVLKLVIE
ncbi:MAG: T9SS type A sorting domain-containing protein [Chitinophagaceae bacterium]|nr:T9SS type A sorting domain-containing protein [Chitinophagaceae bacterium]